MINSSLVKGLLIGFGVSAAGFYLYKKNEQKIDSFLRSHGFPIADSRKTNFSEMSLEELMETKEDIEDIIAERELNSEEEIVSCSQEAEQKA